jgi:hypothetical protein
LVKFNRWEPETSGRFTFLGFDFFWRKTLRNPKHRKVTRNTNGKKYRASLAALKEWLKKARSKPLREISLALRRKLQGYWNYYCVIGNSEKTGTYAYHVRGLVFKWTLQPAGRFCIDIPNRSWMQTPPVRCFPPRWRSRAESAVGGDELDCTRQSVRSEFPAIPRGSGHLAPAGRVRIFRFTFRRVS